MWDLYVAVALIVLLSAACWKLGTVVGDRFSPASTFAIVAASVGLFIIYCCCLFGDLALARVIPYPSVVVLGNWLPLGAAFFAGLLYRQRDVAAWRRTALLGSLILGGVYSVGGQLLTQPPEAGACWSGDGICRQTTDASCSPCAAVTLLNLYDIPSTEKEMMRLCLTGRRGTGDLGLYRGLKLKTRPTEWDVEPFRTSVTDLWKPTRGPAILFVRLDRRAGSEDYRQRAGWLPGVGHSVVVLGLTDDGRLAVADPAVGLEYWTRRDLEVLWRGEGLHLVPRSPETPVRRVGWPPAIPRLAQSPAPDSSTGM
jgi:hypothetical protein